MKHKDIQRIYRRHILLANRNEGGVKRLAGDVVVVVFFVNDAESKWTEFDKLRYKTNQEEAFRFIVSSAKKRGVRLKMRIAYGETTVNLECEPNNYSDWSKKVIQNHKFGNVLQYQNGYKKHFGCDEAPVFFVFNKKFRSCAVSVDSDTRGCDELSMISSSDRPSVIAHELLHQFGANDFYYIDEIKSFMKERRYHSIMGPDQDMYIDSLTAYLIGWTDEISSTAVEILEKTKHISKADMAERLRDEWRKGWWG